MKPAPLPDNEIARLSALYEYDVLDTLPEKDFDDITKIASEICQTPISLVSLIDAKRQWFKSRRGVAVKELPRDIALCAYAILNPGEVLIVPDSHKDPRFADNPLVTNEPHLAFYAGVPLVTDDGYALGTLCVLDRKPRDLSERQLDTLKALADQVVGMLEIRKQNKELHERERELAKMNKELEQFAQTVAHDLKSPCNNMIAISDLLRQEHASQLDIGGLQMLEYLKEVSLSLKDLIDNILYHARTVYEIETNKEYVTFSQLMKEIKPLLPIPKDFELNYREDDHELYLAKTALMQILLNLCTNAIKYNDKEKGIIEVSYRQDERYYHFTVSDNGMGIPSSSFNKIFEMFQTLDHKDGFNISGHGIGLSTVKDLVEKLGGNISVASEVGKGSSFDFTIAK